MANGPPPPIPGFPSGPASPKPATIAGKNFPPSRASGWKPKFSAADRPPAGSRKIRVLRHLEENWAQPVPFPDHSWDAPARGSLRAVICANPEGEAVLAAREILQFVRAGGRFREAAVLLRSLEGYHDVLRRVFSRYGIPFFLDRREPSAHHPLAELTRNALRVLGLRLAARGLVQRPENRPCLRRRRGH